MSDFTIDDEAYIILLKYFDGDVRKLDKDKVKSLNQGNFDGKEIEKVDKKILKVFAKIIKLKKENPQEYRKTKWIYPDWKDDEEEVLKKLKDKFPDDYKEEDEETDKINVGDIVLFEDDGEQLSGKVEKIVKGKYKVIDDDGEGYMKNLEELTLKKEDEEELEEVKNIEEVYRSILPQRKAFIEWVNDVFYQELLENHKDLKDELA